MLPLSGALAERYRKSSSWGFLPADADQRKQWIAAELGRLQQRRFGAPDVLGAPA